MSKPIIIFGAGEIAQLAHFYFEKEGRLKVSAFSVDDDYIKENSFCDLPVVPSSKLTELYPPQKYDAFVAVSYAKMNQVRQEKCAFLKALGYGLASYVSPHCTNFAKHIGENCFILEDNTLQPFCSIGDNVTLWSGNHIGHHSTIRDNVFVSSHVVISGGVTIENNCFLGVNATLRDHITLGAFTMLGAGVLVTRSTEPHSVLRAPKSELLSIKSTDLKGI